MHELKVSIVIPVYNEEDSLPNALESLRNQYDLNNKLISKNKYQIIIVNNNSIDGTLDIIHKYQMDRDFPKCYLVNQEKKGVIPSRIAGMNYVINSDSSIYTEYLASGDADVIFHPNWVFTIIDMFENTNADILSFAGNYPYSFYSKVPIMTNKFANNVGTIFFDNETINSLGLKGKNSILTENIYIDFGKPVVDSCTAFRTVAYQRSGGYTREYFDKEETREFFAEGGRLMFRMEKNGYNLAYINNVYYIANPRRVLNEPDKFLTGTTYNNGMNDLNQVLETQYEYLDSLAEKLDFTAFKCKYIVEYYIIIRCITNINNIRKNKEYFNGFINEYEEDIINWWYNHENPKGIEVFGEGKVLSEKYFERIFNNILLNYNICTIA